MWGRLLLGVRKSEWLLLAYFAYVAALAPFFRDRPRLDGQPFVVLLLVFVIVLGLAVGERYANSLVFNYLRDWIPIAITLLAFREMDLFRPAVFPLVLERQWIRQDFSLLIGAGLKHAIESTGALLPFYLEACYFLVYGTAAFSVAVFYFVHERERIDYFYLIYLAGTLGAYALFPFFPSEPPRLLYPHLAAPAITTWARTLNLFLLRKATIHMSVYPSAHVSSVFSAAWALFLLQPKRKWLGVIALIYAISVAIATVYGRYHYVADAIAGIAISVLAVLLARVLDKCR